MVGNITSFKEYQDFEITYIPEVGSRNVVCSKTYFGLLLLHIINQELCKNNQKLLFVVKNIKELLKLKNYIEYNYPKIPVYLFRENKFHGESKFLQQKDVSVERLEVFARNIPSNHIVISTISALQQRTLSLAELRRAVLNISLGDELDPEEFTERLNALGYVKKERVFSKSEYASRGNIVDVYSCSDRLPHRIEFLGDIVTSIRVFETDTMASVKESKEVCVYPASEFPRLIPLDRAQQLVHEKYIENDVNKWNRKQITDAIKHGLAFKEQYCVNQLYWQDSIASIENFSDYRMISLCSLDSIEKNLVSENSHINLSLKKDQELGEISLEFDSYFLDYEEFRAIIERDVKLFVNRLEVSTEDNQQIHNLKQEIQNQKSSLDKIICINDFARINDMTIVFQLNHEKSAKKLKYTTDGIKNLELSDLVSLEDALNERSNLNRPSLNYGFFSFDDYVFNERLNILYVPDLFNISLAGVEKKKKNLNQVLSLESFKDIKIDNFLVHVNFGIGKYKGLVTLDAAGIQEDFITIEYHGNDKIYVPVDRISLIEKFQGMDDSYHPRVDKLRTASWENKKSRASKKIRDIADKLLKVHALRQMSKRNKYRDKDETYFEFENLFPYVETPDQWNAIEDVHQDLSGSRPMDRLICGDVGFGKTEVAIRAALRVVVNGFQVMFIAPTTVLSHQHFINLRARFDVVGINVALINRFISTKEARSVLKDFSEGKIDILIGTHRLLSKDIKPKKLGLFIIDEEQRFGVEHKEKVKDFNANVDILTLSATPIPRSLNLAILGLKDVSVITTAPMERLPIQTYYMDFSDAVIKSAIEKELDRGGQVFFIHNRVESISEFANYLKNLVPNSKILVAHGQQKEKELEKNIINFMEGHFDVLVCTTIIESGVDMPNVNTILVNNSDRFGLAQLYQLRGRVGRSNIQSFAYFFVRGVGAISSDAQQRLDILTTHNDLGMGFKIAQYDLELRGAGNILGSDQSGRINDIGYELYMNLLKEEVERQRGDSEKASTYVQAELNLKLDARIPVEFIGSESDRLKLYRDLFKVRSIDALTELEANTGDTYGKLPLSFRKLFILAKIKIMASDLGIKQINSKKEIEFVFDSLSEKMISNILNVAEVYERVEVTSDFRLKVSMDKGKDDIMLLDSIIEILTAIAKGK